MMNYTSITESWNILKYSVMTFTQGSSVRFLRFDFYSTYHENALLVKSPDKSYHEIAQQMTQRVSQEIFQGLRRFPENLLCIDFSPTV